MPKFTLEIDMNNAAFSDEAGSEELARCLLALSDTIPETRTPSGVIWDTNGNKVGQWAITE